MAISEFTAPHAGLAFWNVGAGDSTVAFSGGEPVLLVDMRELAGSGGRRLAAELAAPRAAPPGPAAVPSDVRLDPP